MHLHVYIYCLGEQKKLCGMAFGFRSSTPEVQGSRRKGSSAFPTSSSICPHNQPTKFSFSLLHGLLPLRWWDQLPTKRGEEQYTKGRKVMDPYDGGSARHAEQLTRPTRYLYHGPYVRLYDFMQACMHECICSS